MKMKDKRDIYCEYSFWESFFEMEDKVLKNRTQKMNWCYFYSFLSNNILYFDINREEADSESVGGQNIQDLLQAKGGANINFISQDFPKIADLKIDNNDDQLLNSVFLTMSETTVCEKMSKRYGVLILNLSMVLSSEYLYMDTGITFDRDRNDNWSFLDFYKKSSPGIRCCNSIVLIDKYLFHNQTTPQGYDRGPDILNHNIGPILDSLIPEKLDSNILFCFYIVSEYEADKPIGDKIKVYEDIIKEKCPNIRYKIVILDPWKNGVELIHDRALFTNYFFINPGAGFDVIGSNDRARRKSDVHTHFPFLYKSLWISNNASTDKNNYLDWIFKVLKVNKSCNSYEHNYWGSRYKKHHLLDYYSEGNKIKKQKLFDRQHSSDINIDNFRINY